MKYINKVKLKLIHEILKQDEDLDFEEIYELLDLLVSVYFKKLE